ncbi:hypothetical protein SD71_04110 [Cohnella kolymensis]|uniref:Uncharacterized protein n=1 Tax=Cohnella kolymensis TaxID=1590652 RepID=A0ABR5A777_9BACL|nr:hypothetical protein [Cohnella kolymensis]KIL36914.1 hypothetical protein SD71_04110 [Cohnella kolymensis]
MRQTGKDAKLQRLMREVLLPDRREAMAFGDGGRNALADPSGTGTAGAGQGRRHPPGVRG